MDTFFANETVANRMPFLPLFSSLADGPTQPNTGRPEPTVTWMNGEEVMQTGGGVSMGRHVTVNRLEIHKITRAALNNTYKCQASNTILVPPAERSVRVEMLRKYPEQSQHRPVQD